jgi:hypothetical protein
MVHEKCSFAGCKQPSSIKVKTLWGKQIVMNFCSAHTPDWAKNGATKSPVLTMCGVTKSWYERIS